MALRRRRLPRSYLGRGQTFSFSAVEVQVQTFESLAESFPMETWWTPPRLLFLAQEKICHVAFLLKHDTEKILYFWLDGVRMSTIVLDKDLSWVWFQFELETLQIGATFPCLELWHSTGKPFRTYRTLKGGNGPDLSSFVPESCQCTTCTGPKKKNSAIKRSLGTQKNGLNLEGEKKPPEVFLMIDLVYLSKVNRPKKTAHSILWTWAWAMWLTLLTYTCKVMGSIPATILKSSLFNCYTFVFV